MQQPLVSVIIPAYNRAAYIERAVNSILAQTYKNWELIVVDDASTDETVTKVRGFTANNIHLYRHSINRGANAARNTGIQKANGKYIAFLDSDDEWMDHKLEKQMKKFLEGSPTLGVVTCLVQKNFNGNEQEIVNFDSQGWILEEVLKDNCVGGTSAPLIRYECFDEVGLFDTSLKSGQEWDLWIRIARHFTFDTVPEVLVKYHYHSRNISSDKFSVFKGHEQIIEKYWDDIEKLGPDVIADHYKNLGYLSSIRFNDKKWARYYFCKAIRYRPFRFKFYLDWIGTWLNKKVVEKSESLRIKLGLK